MCGIAGIFDLNGENSIDRAALERMNQAQIHRGPDEGGIHIEAGVGLAHRRLSIIDLASGQQPMFSDDRKLCVVYNGEIYNFSSIAEELKSYGHSFQTHCDTEVILYAWKQWGPDCVKRMRGMFAFALFDAEKQCLFLARDRLGIKPLFYVEVEPGRVLFASELKALLQYPGLDRKLRADAVEDYFTLGYVPDPKTILQNVHKLAPGHTLLLSRTGPVPSPVQYWDVRFQHTNHDSIDDIYGQLRDQLGEAVAVRLIAEVPLGAFLSGGVDSSAVVAAMAGLQENPVNTCAIGFDVEEYDESEHAQKVADLFHTNHSLDVVSSEDFALLDDLGKMYDEPFADSSAIPTYRVCQAARKRVTVALSGDGGDEVFAGYRRHRMHMNEEKLRAWLPAKIRGWIFGLAGKIYPKLDWAPQVLRAKSTFQALARSPVDAYLHSVSITTEAERKQLFSKQLANELSDYSTNLLFHEHANRSDTDNPLSLIQYLDIKTWLPGDILTKVDRASMAHSLEVRVPLLDHQFVEWAAGLSPELLISGSQGKSVFKQALKPDLPDDILFRSKKGFSVPISEWLRGPLRTRCESALTSGWLVQSGYFNSAYLGKITREHLSGRRDHGRLIWALLMFESSCQHLLGVPQT